MGKTIRAAVEFSLQWESVVGVHHDRFYIERVDFWRDFFPGTIGDSIAGLSGNEYHRESFPPGVLVPAHRADNIKEVKRSLLLPEGDEKQQRELLGRYYPRGSYWKALNSFPGDISPMRVIDLTETTITVDMNHPLSRHPLTLVCSAPRNISHITQRGGSAQDIGALVTSGGTGMQVPHPSENRSSHPIYPLLRPDEGDDKQFYRSARMVHHLDERALSHVRSLYSRLLQPGNKVLDLMASWDSHLVEPSRYSHLTGLGLNEEELQRNEAFHDYLIHDLNRVPELPFGANSFDGVICTVSIEYLTRPYEIFAELARILKPGGLLVVTISERWFPTKAITSWENLHPFERQGLVIRYFMEGNHFVNIHTESIRGYPRPSGDKYYHHQPASDSLFFVWGYVPE